MEKLMEEKEEQLEAGEKKYNKLQWFFLVIIIPTLFALTVAVLVATIAGVNVFEKADEWKEKIPFLPDKEEISARQATEELESRLTGLRAEVKDREAAIAELEKQLESKDQEIKKLELEKEQLQMQIDDLLIAEEEGANTFTEIVSTYETMSAKKAAPIITELDDEEAIKILANLKPDTLVAILEKMTSIDAAKYTAMLTDKNSMESIE